MNPDDQTSPPKQTDAGWVEHPLHPTRVRFEDGLLQIEQRTTRRFRFGPILSTAVMAWLHKHSSWDADDDSKFFWSIAFTVMGDWDTDRRGLLQLVCGGDGRPGLRRGRKPGRITNDLAAGWRGTRIRAPWLDLTTTGVIPLVLHYKPSAQTHPALWFEVLTMAQNSLLLLPGRSAYQLAQVLDLLPEPSGPCVYCGSPDDLTHDHANPLDLGGLPWGDNLVAACNACNRDKGATPLHDWLTTHPTPHNPNALAAATLTLDAPRTLP